MDIFLFSVLFSGMSLSIYGSQPTAYKVQGELQTFTVTETATNSHTDALFEMVSQGKQWRLKVEYVRLPSKGPKYREFAGDGTDIYQLVSWDPALIDNTKSSNTEMARVSRGDIPDIATPVDYAAWFAMAGHHYFKSRTNSSMRNIFFDVRTNSVNFQASFSERYPSSMRNLRIYKPGLRYFRSKKAADGNITKPPPPVRLPPPYDAGFIGAEYQTLSWTNTSAVEIPSEFRLDYFALRSNPMTGGYELARTDVINGRVLSVTEIEAASDEQMLPMLTSKTTIIERRLEGVVGTAVYDSRQAGWADGKDPKFTNTVKVLRTDAANASSGLRRTATKIIVVSAIGLVPVALFCMKNAVLKRKTNHHL
ncbi:MAG TPA: hypothetical protein VFZ59_17790 [Verrucomicrobiae bacterium]|nr:hypothetical protein [Verrucomicrobiae bacterium]